MRILVVEDERRLARSLRIGLEAEGFAVDLNRLGECREPEALALARLVAMIQAERQDFNGRVLTVRGDDLRALAYFLLTSPEELCGRLTGLGLQALPA